MGSSNSVPVDQYGCPSPEGKHDYNDVGTAWSTMRWVALGCTGATAACSLSLIFQHLRRYRAPKEQRQIIRIAFSNALYSAIAFFCIWKYADADYINPLGDLYEAFGLCALFLLFVQYAAPSGTFNEETFAAVKAREESETTFMWPKLSWIFVFQYPIVQVITLIIEEATLATGHYCVNSLSPKFAHIWLEVAQSISIGACIIAILKFRGNMKHLMATKRGLSKIVLFKLVVAIRFLQQWIFSILLDNHAIKVSEQFRYNDILWGIPSTLTCAEMIIFAAAFWYAFSPSEYSSSAHRGQAMPIWKAVPHALNPTDLVLGMARVIPLFLEVRRSGDWALWRASKKQQKGKGGPLARLGALGGRLSREPAANNAPYTPIESHHMRNTSTQSNGDDGAFRVLSPSMAYQSPSGSPDGMRTHLMAGQELQRQGRWHWNGQSYEWHGPSRDPSPMRL